MTQNRHGGLSKRFTTCLHALRAFGLSSFIREWDPLFLNLLAETHPTKRLGKLEQIGQCLPSLRLETLIWFLSKKKEKLQKRRSAVEKGLGQFDISDAKDLAPFDASLSHLSNLSLSWEVNQDSTICRLLSECRALLERFAIENTAMSELHNSSPPPWQCGRGYAVYKSGRKGIAEKTLQTETYGSLPRRKASARTEIESTESGRYRYPSKTGNPTSPLSLPLSEIPPVSDFVLVDNVVTVGDFEAAVKAVQKEAWGVAAIDCEWSSGGAPLALVQVCLGSRGHRMVWLLDMQSCSKELNSRIKETFQALCRSSRILKLGFSFQTDLQRLVAAGMCLPGEIRPDLVDIQTLVATSQVCYVATIDHVF